MTIEARNEYLWGLIKGEPKVLEPGERINLKILPSFPPMANSGKVWFLDVENPDKVSLQQAEAKIGRFKYQPYQIDVDGNKKDNLVADEINRADLARPTLSSLIGYRKRITWRPTP